MYYSMSLLAGMLISVMVVFNGSLNARVGQLAALVVIHSIGLAVIGLTMLAKGEKPRFPKLPVYLYVGGFIGVLTTVFNNTAFGHISVSAMMALSLLGESLSGLAADHYGFLGIPKRAFRTEKLWGALLTLIGIAVMITEFRLVPMLVSLLAGLTVLVSRLINARMAVKTSVPNSTFLNYLMGLILSVGLYLWLGSGSGGLAAVPGGDPTMYLGGALGVAIVLMSNAIVGKIPSVYMSLAIFVGQVFAGILLDRLLMGDYSMRNLLGGLFVLAGLSLSLWQDRQQGRKNTIHTAGRVPRGKGGAK